MRRKAKPHDGAPQLTNDYAAREQKVCPLVVDPCVAAVMQGLTTAQCSSVHPQYTQYTSDTEYGAHRTSPCETISTQRYNQMSFVPNEHLGR